MNLKQIKKYLNENAELVFKELGMNCEVFNDNIYSTCPVHEGSDNPRAFSFSKTKCMWKCWTRDCQLEYSRDIFGVIRGALSQQSGEELEFKDALRWACKTFNISNTSSFDDNSKTKVIEESEDPIYQIVNTFSSTNNIHIPESVDFNYDITVPSSYFVDRGFNKRTIKYFGVGDCHVDGIIKERAIIPIHDDTGSQLVGVIGRSVKEYRMPKFLFYPKGFDKRYYFYNLHRAIKKATETSCLYIVEGQSDVWRLYESGVKNVVSIFGKTITEQQKEKLLKLPITHLIILTDNDQAGRESKMQIKRNLGRLFRLTFPKFSGKDVGEISVKKIKSDILVHLKGTY